MTYNEVLEFLYSQLPMYQKVGKSAFKKDLNNTIKLCEALDNPHHKFDSIHIAGTNGKGSTAHMIAGILQSSGLKVGLYTSPHYRDFRERIKINGRYISKHKVIDFVQRNQEAIQAIRPSFFEMTVGLAFEYFATQKVDVAVIETGLGGRLDSTNILKPLISVITNIGLDHQAMLGDTIPQIAFEKAGIMKSDTTCVIGIHQSETKETFNKVANDKNASIVYAEDIIGTNLLDQSISQSIISIKVTKNENYKIKLPTGVSYNVENCRTAIATILSLNSSKGFGISTNEIQEGLLDFPKTTRYMGRWQVKSTEPLVLLDAAHNEDGIKGLVETIAEYSFDRIHIVLGMVSDKDAAKVLSMLPKNAKYYFCKPNIPRGKSAQLLKTEALKFDLKGRSYVSCKNALKAAKRSAGKNDLILGTGSSFVVAELV